MNNFRRFRSGAGRASGSRITTASVTSTRSVTGNPLACAAALATLELFGQYDTLNNNRALAARMSEALDRLPEHPHFGDMRQTDMIAAIERVRDKASNNPYAWRERRGLQLYRSALDQGAILRPLGNVAYFMPPYVITPEEIGWQSRVVPSTILVVERRFVAAARSSLYFCCYSKPCRFQPGARPVRRKLY